MVDWEAHARGAESMAARDRFEVQLGDASLPTHKITALPDGLGFTVDVAGVLTHNRLPIHDTVTVTTPEGSFQGEITRVEINEGHLKLTVGASEESTDAVER